MPVDQCPDCRHEFSISEVRCPHCGRPSRFPNVRDAELEADALTARYNDAKMDAANRGDAAVVEQFEQACRQSVAVIARSFDEAFRLATSDLELYATHYQLQTLRIPGGLPPGPGQPNWDRIRAVADEALFGKQKEEIRFAALSLDGVGLANYGECTLVLRDDMIAHRASVVEENSLVFMNRHGVTIWGSAELPRGYRSTWEQRAKLCVAKCGKKLAVAPKPVDFASVLLKQGATTLEDEFVEVHVFGPMTVRTFAKVVLHKKPRRPAKVKLKALREKMAKWNVECEVER